MFSLSPFVLKNLFSPVRVSSLPLSDKVSIRTALLLFINIVAVCGTALIIKNVLRIKYKKTIRHFEYSSRIVARCASLERRTEPEIGPEVRLYVRTVLVSQKL